jgi:hypothetical protein
MLSDTRLLRACLIAMLFWFGRPTLYAQGDANASLDVVYVDTSHFPTIEVAVSSSDEVDDVEGLPFQLYQNGQEQSIVSVRRQEVTLQLAVVIDPDNQLAPGTSGQSHYGELIGALLKLIEADILRRTQDWLAAYSQQMTGELQTIHGWTQEPNLVFNSIVQNQPAETNSNALSTDTLLAVLEQFIGEQFPPNRGRALLLFSTGGGGLQIDPVVARARALHLSIHTVELPAPEAAQGEESVLQRLAEQTGGGYVRFVSTDLLPPLWNRLKSAHAQHILAYRATTPTLQNLEVRTTLLDGSLLSDNVAQAELGMESTASRKLSVTRQTEPTATTRAQAATPLVVALANPESTPELSADDPLNNPAQPIGDADTVLIPGTTIAIPRGILLLTLPILVLLLGYFVYAEVRERRRGATAGRPTSKDRERGNYNDWYALDTAKPVQQKPFQLKDDEADAADEFQVQEAIPQVKLTRKSRPHAAEPRMDEAQLNPAAPAEREYFPKDHARNEEVTVVPPLRLEDEEVTYRPRQAAQRPIIGYLVRVTDSPNLPKELPIYGLPGENRQIHVGRHTQHNTVVINDKSISREHAVLVQKNGRLYLRDNASSAGTFLNWARLNAGEELLLRHNDLISFGEIVYEFRVKGEDE